MVTVFLVEVCACLTVGALVTAVVCKFLGLW